jgi:ketosteroid isomerase-like protein
MQEIQGFLDDLMPRLTQAEIAFHNGDAGPRGVLWTHEDPVTLFGALLTKRGWAEVAPAFDWLASEVRDCKSFEYEVVAAGVSGDLAYIVGVEHTTAAWGGKPAAAYELRVTTIFRREGGEWKVVHRHADHLPSKDDVSEEPAWASVDPRDGDGITR